MGNAKQKDMKIGIYDPYLHILGGAERYLFSIAHCYKGEEVTFFANGQYLNQAEKKFGLDLAFIKTQQWPFERKKRQSLLSGYDIMFYITDGSLFVSSAKKNVLIIQSPKHIPKRNIVNLIKMRSWQKVFCYSDFMTQIVKNKLGVKAETVFVPIALPKENKIKKQNQILSVGRFFPNLHSKKQKEMVKFFQELIREGTTDAHLHLVGSIDPGGENYFAEVQKLVHDLPITIHTNISYPELIKLYQSAKVYWHATGYGEDLVSHPERAEHFGVTTVEAMSYKAVPIVFAGGGQTEIVIDGSNGFIWKDGEQLKKYTKEILHNQKMYAKLSEAAYRTASGYSQDKFCEKLHEVLAL